MRWRAAVALGLAVGLLTSGGAATLSYPIVETGQSLCYGERTAIAAPGPGSAWFGQDAQYRGRLRSYRDNGDGTVTDLVTGLMWVKARGPMISWQDARDGAGLCRAGGHSDWRMPTIKELYSLIDFNGRSGRSAAASVPYLDTSVFDFAFGDEAAGARLIDAQDWSATLYAGTTMNGNVTAFGVNFVDGRIKGYGLSRRARPVLHYVRYVRGNPSYGINDFVENGDGTVTDRATGLTWPREDSGRAMDWAEALEWVARRNAEHYLGHDGWRLPDAKELQSLVDYSRAPGAADPARRGPAIDPVFTVSSDSRGEYAWYWSSTTHLDNMGAVYVCFGRALGFMNGRWMDVHGAGAQRSDPKSGEAADFPRGLGPQGDEIRIRNHVRPVRGGIAEPVSPQTAPGTSRAPHAAWVERLDRDGDGRVSRGEFDGPAGDFLRFDRDGDGFISDEEAPASPPGGIPRRRRSDRALHRPGRPRAKRPEAGRL